MEEPFLKKRVINSAVFLQATQLIKSAVGCSWDSAVLELRRDTATVKEVTEIPDIAIGARYHHERYDGKGYPDGLCGLEIPELARIIGVADAYDAMTSKRSYRNVLAQDIVLEEIEKGKGTQFDSEIAQIMIELMKDDVNYKMHE